MKTRVIVQSPEEFNTWVTEQLESEEEEDEEVALNPQEKSATEFLAPYSQEMAVSADTLAQLPHPEHSGHHH
jgi:cytochrome c oxidase subunit 2